MALTRVKPQIQRVDRLGYPQEREDDHKKIKKIQFWINRDEKTHFWWEVQGGKSGEKTCFKGQTFSQKISTLLGIHEK